jgi:hypothetical protein
MESLNPNKYRKALFKKLEESDLSKEEKVVIKNKIILGEARGTPLDELRAKLFRDDEDLGNDPTDLEGDVAPDMGLGEEDPTVKELPGEEGDLILGGDELEGEEPVEDDDFEDEDLDDVEGMDDLEGEEGPTNRNMDDLVADTILEILTSFKQIRDSYVDEDPDKAEIVRKVYDYLFKAKDKIANEINKSQQETQLPPTM